MSSETSIVSSTTDIVRFKETDITWLFGPLRPRVDHDGRGHQSLPTHSPSVALGITVKPIVKKSSIHELMLQRSQYTVALLLGEWAVSENDDADYTLPARQSVENAISNVLLEKCVRFDMGSDGSTVVEDADLNTNEQLDLDDDISVNF